MEYMTFFVCESLEGAEAKAMSLRMSGYSTQIREMKERIVGGYSPPKEWEVKGKPISDIVEKDLWQREKRKKKASGNS